MGSLAQGVSHKLPSRGQPGCSRLQTRLREALLPSSLTCQSEATSASRHMDLSRGQLTHSSWQQPERANEEKGQAWQKWDLLAAQSLKWHHIVFAIFYSPKASSEAPPAVQARGLHADRKSGGRPHWMHLRSCLLCSLSCPVTLHCPRGLQEMPGGTFDYSLQSLLFPPFHNRSQLPCPFNTLTTKIYIHQLERHCITLK